MVWKERNVRDFEEIEGEMLKVMNRWLHIFGSLILAHDIYRVENFRNVIDLLTDL